MGRGRGVCVGVWSELGGASENLGTIRRRAGLPPSPAPAARLSQSGSARLLQ